MPCPPFDFWLCIDPDLQFGELNSYGCNVGCHVCDDYDLKDFNGSRSGRRWLLPHTHWQSRDARGYYHDLRTGQPWRVMNTMNYLAAPCFHHQGRECHNAQWCQCYPPVTTDPAGIRCDCGEPFLTRLVGAQHDCSWMLGYGWPVEPGSTLICRVNNEQHQIALTVGGGRLAQAIFLRSSGTGGKGCISNVLIPLMARVAGSACESAYLYQPVGNPDRRYYFNQGDGGLALAPHPLRSAHWKDLRILVDQRTTLHALGPPAIKANAARFPYADQKAIAVKNAAIRKVLVDQMAFPDLGSGTGERQFDKIESKAIITDANGELDIWEREWSGTGLDVALLPTVFSMPSCYLMNAKCPVRVDIVFFHVRVEMSLVLHMELQDDNAESNADFSNAPLWLLPSARFRMRARLGLRAALTAACPGVTIGHRTYTAGGRDPIGHLLPVVNSATPDRIIYVHPTDGQSWNPPLDANWMGMNGPFSVPAWKNSWYKNGATDFTPKGGLGWFPTPGDSLVTISTRLQQSLNWHCISSDCTNPANYDGLKVTGWPWMTDSDPADPQQVYVGGVPFGLG